eukprot:m.184913 g.184913  ORF g.184913 m.184913 type:complete len:127 (+) comp14722_c2_seq5:608-988(+)
MDELLHFMSGATSLEHWLNEGYMEDLSSFLPSMLGHDAPGLCTHLESMPSDPISSMFLTPGQQEASQWLAHPTVQEQQLQSCLLISPATNATALFSEALPLHQQQQQQQQVQQQQQLLQQQQQQQQ